MRKFILLSAAFLLMISCSLKFLNEKEFKDTMSSGGSSGGIALVPFPGIYVSTTGNDSNDGLTPETAKATIQAGIDTANSGSEKRVLVSAGIYSSGAITFPGNDITVEGGYSTDFLTRDMGNNITTIDKSGSTSWAVYIMDMTSRNNITIDGLKIINTTTASVSYGVYCYNAANFKIQNCDIYNQTPVANNCIGVYSYNSSGSLINNTIYPGTSTGTGIGMGINLENNSGGPYTVDIYNNTIDNGDGAGSIDHCIYISHGAITTVSSISNNILISNSASANRSGIAWDTPLTLNAGYNAFVNLNAGKNAAWGDDYAAGGQIPTNLFADYNPFGARDWHLKTKTVLEAAGFFFAPSAGEITQGGLDLSGVSLTTDKDGKSRTSGWSRGAYEQDL